MRVQVCVPDLDLGLIVTFCNLGRKILQTHGSGECLAHRIEVWAEGVGLDGK